MPVNEGLSRRAFLAAIGKLAGSSAMLKAAAAIGLSLSASGCGSSNAAEATDTGSGTSDGSSTPPSQNNPFPLPEDWPQGVGNGKSVIILGAGIAGLSAAWEMQKLGYECRILEATNRAGGRCRTVRQGDRIEETDSVQTCDFDNDPALYFNVGPARIPHHHTLLLGYCREFGVALEPFINENNAALYHDTQAFAGQPQTARSIKADARGYISALLADAINQSALDQTLSETEKAQMLAVLQQFGDLRGNLDYSGSSRAGYPGISQAQTSERDQQFNPAALSTLLQNNFWAQHLNFTEDLQQQPTMLQPVGGMDNIASAFAQRLDGLIDYLSRVNRIENTATGISIDYVDDSGVNHNTEADYCLCTIPAPVLAGIDNNFSAAHRNEIANFNYTKACKIAFQSARFWEQENSIYGGISWTNQTMTQLWYPSNGFGQSQGILVGAYTFSDAAGNAFAAMVPEQRISTALSQGSRLHNQYGQQAVNGISISWPKIPFQLGGWGQSSANILLQPDNNCYFAGEHLSILQGWQEGAILSAYHAIDQIVTRDSNE